jgi:hypothetical protein
VTRIALIATVCAAALLTAASAGTRTTLPGLMTSKAPWPANNGPSLRPRLRAIGMPALSAEGTKLHIHQHLDVVVRGMGRPVAAGIGIDRRGRFIAPLHTHDYSGILHVESPTVRRFTLGEFFDVWGLRFSSKCLGAYCEHGKERVWVYVNGELQLRNPRQISLRQHQEIVVAYGTFRSIPKPIPRAYPFPPGY